MLYTGHGDAGYTSVIGGPRLLKCDTRLDVLGALDEAQAHLGVARALLASTPWGHDLRRVQDDLRLLMADCATVGVADEHHLTPDRLTRLEDDLRQWDAQGAGFHGLTAPGASPAEAHLHLARTVIRRAERHLVALATTSGRPYALALRYLNRLSSWAYALAVRFEV